MPGPKSGALGLVDAATRRTETDSFNA